MTLTQIQINSRNKVHDSRNLDYFINTEKFKNALELANDIEYGALTTGLEAGCILIVRTLCNNILSNELEEKNIKQLREIASRKFIPNYNRYTKSGLLNLIKERNKNEERTGCN